MEPTVLYPLVAFSCPLGKGEKRALCKPWSSPRFRFHCLGCRKTSPALSTEISLVARCARYLCRNSARGQVFLLKRNLEGYTKSSPFTVFFIQHFIHQRCETLTFSFPSDFRDLKLPSWCSLLKWIPQHWAATDSAGGKHSHSPSYCTVHGKRNSTCTNHWFSNTVIDYSYNWCSNLMCNYNLLLHTVRLSKYKTNHLNQRFFTT